MAEPFIGELRAFSFDFAPRGWAQCGGQLLPINQNQALFSLLGTMYGGNGQTNFALPNLRGRTAVGQGTGTGLSSIVMGQAGGSARHTLTPGELPAHNHGVKASSGFATEVAATAGQFATPAVNARLQPLYSNAANAAARADAVSGVGGNQPHENRRPYLAMNYCIAIQGIFPSRN
jgi:microcystin-dependent protein